MPGSIRYFIFFAFKGTIYHGWQVQPNSVTVQQIIENRLSLILGEKINVTGAGRTDTGVHARFFAAHFNCNLPDLTDNSALLNRINRFLPPDIAVISVKKVKSDAHSRFSALSRTYEYCILRTKDPFLWDSGWLIKGIIDLEILNKAADILKNHNDFTSFCKLHSENKTNFCRIFSAHWKEHDNRIIFTIKADRFLRNMVRAITGTMIDAGLGRISLIEFEDIIKARNRSRAGKSAPAKGLFLVDIDYPEDIFIS